ncbi:DUF1428 domain-containing protein [Thauera sinica]|uniref:DUF1428 domain-containing protein n=1 Tax=Thauera sinica TaxID=2665146 RepID=A0ABW1APY7_9RHOO|nr:DUF1428 domain-containing protein [Thauera sp. K11]ATE59514.1 RNA signal recognition particle [Thauera sp. K11]
MDNTGKYVDGFLIPVPKDRIGRYREIASLAGQVWMEHGALQYYECIGDDLEIKDMVPFPRAAGAGAEDAVIFSWIVYESRAHRDEVNAAVMADPRMKSMMNDDAPPFDCKRMAYGGFRTLVVLDKN